MSSTARDCGWRSLEKGEDSPLDGWTAGGAIDAVLDGLRAGGFVVLPVADAEGALDAIGDGAMWAEHLDDHADAARYRAMRDRIEEAIRGS